MAYGLWFEGSSSWLRLMVAVTRPLACRRIGKRFSTTPFGGAIGYGTIIGIADDRTRFHLRWHIKFCRPCFQISLSF
ncbi:hypothetical protein NR402_15780 [Acidithiobacillus ferrooxidans]|uniref:hypothetical protein n=1 Tax=Acidithiobacillus ferrooxidans TaxID=920 RepID=UPI00214BB05D|nr:hypothetical protein [Acidithiobacillus ferrooxidans]MCR2831729.1 hypothetical protein [Acidithiobacillus ferrooxidans]